VNRTPDSHVGFGADRCGSMSIEQMAWVMLMLIHALPALSLVRPSLITKLYGVSKTDHSFLLLHHRAALFFMVVVTCLWCCFDVAARPLGSVCLAISMFSFLGLFVAHGSPKPLRTIALADLLGLPAVAYALWSAFV
jgi:hypothetical protein